MSMNVISGKSTKLIAEELLSLSFKAGAKYSTPTPLISPFWGTTFTPSSTEVYARDLASSNSNIITTIQPCIRFVDFGHIGDDTHLLFFHMWSCFFPNVIEKFYSYTESIFEILESVIAVKRNAWHATYYPFKLNETNVNHDFTKIFDEKLLLKSGLNKNNCYAICGTSTYLHKSQKNNFPQNNSTHLTGTPAEQIEGPRIEFFVKTSNGDFVEIATIVLFSGSINLPGIGPIVVPPSLAIAAGIERLAPVRFKKSNIYEIDIFNSIHSEILKSLPACDIAFIFKKDIQRLISLILAESAIKLFAPQILDKSNFGPNKEK